MKWVTKTLPSSAKVFKPGGLSAVCDLTRDTCCEKQHSSNDLVQVQGANGTVPPPLHGSFFGELETIVGGKKWMLHHVGTFLKGQHPLVIFQRHR